MLAADHGFYRDGTVDGVVGEKMQSAIRAFQSVVQLPITGIFAPDIVSAMRQYPAKRIRDDAGSSAGGTAYSCAGRVGWQLESMFEVQTWLMCHNFFENGLRTGKMDLATATALRTFQSSVDDLEVTGLMDDATAAAMINQSSGTQFTCSADSLTTADDVLALKNFFRCEYSTCGL